MPSAASNSSPVGKKLCVICGEKIPAPAAKCTHCESFQDWRRYVSFSTTVISSSLPGLVELFRGHDSKLAVAFQADDREGGILLLASNSGDRPGGIAEITLRVPVKLQQKSFAGILDERVANSVLSPQQSTQFRVMFFFEEGKPSEKDIGDKCELVVRTAEFSGHPGSFSFPRPCKDFSMLGNRSFATGTASQAGGSPSGP
jgi:ribosomal protein L40E